MDSKTFVYVSYIKTTPEKLWHALTNEEFSKKYWGGGGVESDWKVGSPIRAIGKDEKSMWEGKVLRFDPTTAFSHTFKDVTTEKLKNEPVSRVLFELVPKGALVKLTVTHDECSSPIYEAIGGGWPQIISALKTVVETGDSVTLPPKG